MHKEEKNLRFEIKQKRWLKTREKFYYNVILKTIWICVALILIQYILADWRDLIQQYGLIYILSLLLLSLIGYNYYERKYNKDGGSK